MPTRTLEKRGPLSVANGGLDIRALRDGFGLTRPSSPTWAAFIRARSSSGRQERSPGGPASKRCGSLRGYSQLFGGIRSSPAVLGGWLKAPNEVWGGTRPVDLIVSGQVDSIWRLLYAWDEGDMELASDRLDPARGSGWSGRSPHWSTSSRGAGTRMASIPRVWTARPMVWVINSIRRRMSFCQGTAASITDKAREDNRPAAVRSSTACSSTWNARLSRLKFSGLKGRPPRVACGGLPFKPEKLRRDNRAFHVEPWCLGPRRRRSVVFSGSRSGRPAPHLARTTFAYVSMFLPHHWASGPHPGDRGRPSPAPPTRLDQCGVGNIALPRPGSHEPDRPI